MYSLILIIKFLKKYLPNETLIKLISSVFIFMCLQSLVILFHIYLFFSEFVYCLWLCVSVCMFGLFYYLKYFTYVCTLQSLLWTKKKKKQNRIKSLERYSNVCIKKCMYNKSVLSCQTNNTDDLH